MAKGSAGTGCGYSVLILIGLFILGQCVGDQEGTETAGGSGDEQVSLLSNPGLSGQDEITSSENDTQPPTGNSVRFAEGDTAYVTANSLNGRSSTSERSSVVTRIPYGESVRVVERSGSWMRVASNAGDVWVSSSYLSTTSPAPRPRYTQPPRSSYSGSCPCSGSNVCIGPRGGRYCITSGGNKRYGV